MIASKRFVPIRDLQELVLRDLPFLPGQRVEVLLLTEFACLTFARLDL